MTNKIKITRKYFKDLIQDVPDWESCLTSFQKEVVYKWLYEGKTFKNIAIEMNMSRTWVNTQVSGQKFGKYGAVKKIITHKARLKNKTN